MNKKAQWARALLLLLVWGWLPIAQPAAAQDDAQTRQLRLLCAQLSGDLTEPGGMAAFQRCLTTHDPAGEIRRDNNIGSGAVKPGTSLTGSCSNCPAHDPNKPVPLGPGVNKGNIDNQAGPQYYYFLAGPGHVDVRYAFHEMGLFGNPYKQVLNFDIIDQDGNQVLSHDAIESIGNLAKFTRPGDLTKPYRLAIRVSSPDAAIRLGGYFEIEAVGAVRFAGKAAGGNTKPEDTSLVHPGVALTGPQTSLTGPPVALTGPPVALTSGAAVALTSGTPVSLYQPVGALTSVQQSPKELRLTLASDILFDFGRATIRPDARPALDRVAEIIRQNRGAAVTIEGFTDSIGTADSNLRLSNARAESVKHWLIEIEKVAGGAGFASRGFGATRFAAANTKADGSDDPAGRQKNRRVEIVVQKR
jgi:outer membrane protein OmpA-like peptidoglycan-associated protein